MVEMAPEEYFDPLGEGESFWNDGIEKYVFPHEYVNVPVEDLKWLTVCVSELGSRRVDRCQYLNGADVMMQHSIDENEDEELILSTKISDQDYHTTRIRKPSSKSWAVYYDRIDSDVMEGGKYATKELVTNWTSDEIKAFSEVLPNDL